MHNFQTIQNEELATITGGQGINGIPGAWRPNSGMGRPPTPVNPMDGFGQSAAAAEAERRRRNRGGGGGGTGRIQRLQPWM